MLMPTCRTSVSIAMLVMMLMCPAVSAEPWVPQTRKHNEIWHRRDGKIEVHWEWKITPIIRKDGVKTDIWVREDQNEHIRNIRGIGREMDFADFKSLTGMSIYYADGTTENINGRRDRYTREKQVIGLRTRHRHLDRHWELAWTSMAAMEDGFDGPDGVARADEMAQRLSAGGRAAKMLYFETNIEFIDTCGLPAPDLFMQATERRHASGKALDEAREALAKLAKLDEQLEKEAARETAAQLLYAMAQLDDDAPQRPELLYETAKRMDRLNKAGLGIEEYFKHRYGDADPEALKFIDKALKWARAGDTVQQMRKTGEVNVERFVDDTLALIPTNQAGALQGPAGVFFRDTLKWDQKMWSAGTEGLDLVAEAMETGSLDGDRLTELSSRLDQLGKEGPWATGTGTDFLKKMVGGVPVVGKILSALW